MNSSYKCNGSVEEVFPLGRLLLIMEIACVKLVLVRKLLPLLCLLQLYLLLLLLLKSLFGLQFLV
jgi:hypothetical protein